ncbi:hypothetical protein BaRGS_00008313, partial [Batillaria attramentaria]
MAATKYGNATGAGTCAENFTCLGDIGENPNYGYTSFDHVGWGMLSALQLLTLDNWENLNDQMTHINGFYSKPFLFLIVYFGSFYLLNLTLAKEREEMRRIGPAEELRRRQTQFFPDNRSGTSLSGKVPASKDRAWKPRHVEAPGTPSGSSSSDEIQYGSALRAFSRRVVAAPAFDLFIIVSIILNTVVLAVRHHNQPAYMSEILKTANLLWLFKLASEWTTMQILLKITFSTFGTLGNLAFVVGVLNYTIADVGLKLLSPYYNNFDFQNSEGERWHFKDFPHSFVLVFRLLCGDWIRPLWQCLRAANYVCYVVFVPAVVVGHLVLLNLVLALLLNAFNAENLNRCQTSIKK